MMSPSDVDAQRRPRRDAEQRLAELGAYVTRQYERTFDQGNERLAEIYGYAMEEFFLHRNPAPLRSLPYLKRIPVTIEEFVESPDYLGNVVKVWPALMADLKILNPDVLVGEDPVHEAFLGGATGIGKSTVARITLLYQLYMLTCLRSPHRLYGLEASTRFVFPLQSVSPEVTQRVLYEPLRQMFEDMPYARKYLTWNRKKTSAPELEGGIDVVPLLANVESLLGQAIPGAILDEVNHMRIVERSKRVAGPRGQGGRYDQAEEVYSELSQRRRSRFLNQGVSIGCIVVCSSTRYVNDFLDRRIREAEEAGQANVVSTRHKRYDVVPSDRYSGETFSLLIGTDRYRTRILVDDETPPLGARVEDVPVEHLDEFRRDPDYALRNIVGIAVDSITPFISMREKIADAIEEGEAIGLEHWVSNPEVVLERDGFPDWLEAAMPADRRASRFVHIDLSRTRDACGIAIVKCLGMVNVVDPEFPDTVEAKPKFAVEAAISIRPSRDAELQFADLRSWLMQLVDRYQINIYQVSFDGYQSVDFRQVLGRRGIKTVEISVDRSPQHYEYLRECLYEGRIAMVDSDVLRRELIELEVNPETQRIDHPPKGSKDVADAVCGAVAAAARSRNVRTEAGYYDGDGNQKNSSQPMERPAGTPRPQRYVYVPW